MNDFLQYLLACINDDFFRYILICTVLVLILIGIGYIIYLTLQSPYEYPYFTYEFDVSGKRLPKVENLIDTFIIDGNFALIHKHYKTVQNWKADCQANIDKLHLLKKLRQKQYYDCLDDDNMFEFLLIRQQTRYEQSNYKKSSYKVNVIDEEYSYSYSDLKTRYEKLKEINFECTLLEYHSKNQRKLMTPNLRKQIMVRDNYTCQLCGKYMPDEIGLHIDHIIPVSKGGKTIPSNLQVLCSKCNGHKSNNLNQKGT